MASTNDELSDALFQKRNGYTRSSVITIQNISADKSKLTVNFKSNDDYALFFGGGAADTYAIILCRPQGGSVIISASSNVSVSNSTSLDVTINIGRWGRGTFVCFNGYSHQNGYMTVTTS